MSEDDFLREHLELTRRLFLGVAASAAGVAGAAAPPRSALADAVGRIEPYFTAQEKFNDVSRGSPRPHSLDEATKRKVGLTRETWKLEVVADPDHRATLDSPLTARDGTALDFAALLKLGERHAVKFAKVMTCLNIGCPLGMGVWEGVPLRDVLWLARPRENLRRVVYHGYHNDDPKQLFRASLPAGRVLEDPDGTPPVILCYKLNGQFLDAKRGGPVRVVVPEAYGFKSIKWLTHVYLSNIAHANDTYASGNNDLDSPLKTFAATLTFPNPIRAREPVPVTGYAQVGVSGLSKVQVWASPRRPWPKDDSYFTRAPWRDALVLPPPARWANLPGGEMIAGTLGFDERGRPKSWPMRLAKAHWAALLPGMEAGQYVLRCRTIDERGQAQPMPRPFRKSGRCEIEEVKFEVG